jgi:hypothetical protein
MGQEPEGCSGLGGGRDTIGRLPQVTAPRRRSRPFADVGGPAACRRSAQPARVGPPRRGSDVRPGAGQRETGALRHRSALGSPAPGPRASSGGGSDGLLPVATTEPDGVRPPGVLAAPTCAYGDVASEGRDGTRCGASRGPCPPVPTCEALDFTVRRRQLPLGLSSVGQTQHHHHPVRPVPGGAAAHPGALQRRELRRLGAIPAPWPPGLGARRGGPPHRRRHREN